MKEYLREYDSTLTISIIAPSGTTTLAYTLTDIDTGSQFASGNGTLVSGTTFNIVLTKAQAAYDRHAILSVSYNGGASTNYEIAIVRPYATASQIRSELSLDSTEYPDAKIIDLERMARSWIDSNIASFAFKNTKSESFGQGSDAINLNDKVVSVSKIYQNDELLYDTTADPTLNYWDRVLAISPSGYQLRFANEGEDILEWAETTVIGSSPIFKKGSRYMFYGEFGEKFVPHNVYLATVLLVEQFLCQDFGYRSKGIKSISNDAFSLSFADSISLGSGNIFVDSLLAQYKKFNFRAI